MEIHLWSFLFPNVDIVTVTDDIDHWHCGRTYFIVCRWWLRGDRRWSCIILKCEYHCVLWRTAQHSYTCTETESLLGNMVICSGSLIYALKNIWQLAKNICWYPRSCSGCGCVLMLEIWTLAANCPSWGGGWPVWCRCPGPHSAQPITGRDAAVSGGSTNHRPAGSCSASDHAPPPTPGGPSDHIHITHHLLEVGWGNYDRYDWSFI